MCSLEFIFNNQSRRQSVGKLAIDSSLHGFPSGRPGQAIDRSNRPPRCRRPANICAILETGFHSLHRPAEGNRCQGCPRRRCADHRHLLAEARPASAFSLDKSALCHEFPTARARIVGGPLRGRNHQRRRNGSGDGHPVPVRRSHAVGLCLAKDKNQNNPKPGLACRSFEAVGRAQRARRQPAAGRQFLGRSEYFTRHSACPRTRNPGDYLKPSYFPDFSRG